MQSCDTFALGKAWYCEGINYLAKNSDRPLGEAQPLSFFPGGNHQPGETVKCTHLTIPQAAHTYTVLGSRPYWIWGFEMGVNECGLAIGNEAEHSRCARETAEGLLGMDILRLALERAATAREGIDVIAALLTEYGQNANANPLFDRRYENSYMLVDPQEIWLMETAGRQWVAKKINDWDAISNCYSIGTEFDLCSPGLEQIAREKRWIHPDEPFDFAKAYSDTTVVQSGSTPRWRRMLRLIGSHDAPLNREDIKAVLRDYFEGELIEPRYDASRGTFVTICMHAHAWNTSQTAASMLTGWHEKLGNVTWYSPSLPCCSLFIPVYWTGDTPSAMKQADGMYDERSLWWRAERLAMLVSVDEERFGRRIREKLRAVEAAIGHAADNAEAKACALLESGERDAAFRLLAQVTQHAVDDVMVLLGRLADGVSGEIASCGGLYGPCKEFLQAYTERVFMPL